MNFGYFGSGFIGNGDGGGSDIADHCDLTWIAGESPSAIVAAVSRAQSSDLRVIVALEPIFFGPWRDAQPSIHLLHDYDTRWRQVWIALNDAGLLARIAGWFPYDEPFHRAARAGRAEVFRMADRLRLVNAAIRAVHSAPIIACHAWPETLPGHISEMPPADDGFGYDWAGFNLYSDAQLGPPTQAHADTYLAALARIAQVYPSRFPNEPRLVLYPDGQMFPSDTEAHKTVRVQALWQLAQQDARIVAVCPYLWASYQADGYLYRGTRDVSFLRDRYRQIGKEITGK